MHEYLIIFIVVLFIIYMYTENSNEHFDEQKQSQCNLITTDGEYLYNDNINNTITLVKSPTSMLSVFYPFYSNRGMPIYAKYVCTDCSNPNAIVMAYVQLPFVMTSVDGMTYYLNANVGGIMSWTTNPLEATEFFCSAK